MKTLLAIIVSGTWLGLQAETITNSTPASVAPTNSAPALTLAQNSPPEAAQPPASPPPSATTDSSIQGRSLSLASRSPERHFEAGAIFGEPTGASLKYWMNDGVAVDGAIGWSFRDDSDLYLHSDVLWHAFDVFPVSRGALPLYFGVGGLVKFRDHADDIVGVRIPVGISYLFEDAPVSLFLEVAPVLEVSPATRGDFTAGVGVRLRF